MKKLAPLMLIAPFALGGCIRFGAEPPPSLLTLTPAATVAVGETANSATAKSITITVPVTPQELAVARVPVRSDDTNVAYLKKAVWVEPPSRLFARLLSETISARTGRVVLTLRQSLSDPGARLGGELRQFGIDAATSEAVVTYDATLVRDRPPAERGARPPMTFERRRFEARVPVAEITPAAAGVALNTAANQVAAEVADWVGR
ncbi:ABC-type transport auxiliary lipoprotein family protein [Sphingomonas sp. BT-65]|uniref:ABC-type transport auxiliary lipoprotein family protein n=1 Tax=Sphingomonas sp. BT-65 TaxID=2989821 RepID=UPI0022361FC5|nr:ABC-type transport auxiliary lipoprotein family protein [Sphingomonas sp. BT-65]MCW4462059.1 ABC-type transport auxiliary lipoprotein family protein [Sphingomonas sp. BT-65]